MLLRLYEEHLFLLTFPRTTHKQTAATELCREVVMRCVIRNPILPGKYLQSLLFFYVTIIKVIMLAVHVMFEGVSELLLWT